MSQVRRLDVDREKMFEENLLIGSYQVYSIKVAKLWQPILLKE